MNIELIKPETQDKLRKPVLIVAGILVIVGIIWLIAHIVSTNGLSSTEYIDKTSDTVVDTYAGAVTESGNLIYGIESIEDELPAPTYSKIETLTEQFVTYAFPSKQFSYKRSSLRKNEEDDTYSFDIEAKSQKLKVRFSIADDELAELEIISGKTAIYNYSR